MIRRSPAPPDLGREHQLTGRRAVLVAWWAYRNIVVSAWRSPRWFWPAAALISTLCAIVGPVAVILALGVNVLLCRYYFAPDESAVLTVRATWIRPRTWIVANHYARHIGRGDGRRLRELVGPQILAAADAEGVALRLTAASTGLEEAYLTEAPDLGRRRSPLRRTYERNPRTTD